MALKWKGNQFCIDRALTFAAFSISTTSFGPEQQENIRNLVTVGQAFFAFITKNLLLRESRQLKMLFFVFHIFLRRQTFGPFSFCKL